MLDPPFYSVFMSVDFMFYFTLFPVFCPYLLNIYYIQSPSSLDTTRLNKCLISTSSIVNSIRNFLPILKLTVPSLVPHFFRRSDLPGDGVPTLFTLKKFLLGGHSECFMKKYTKMSN